jgi:hypothetical protein
MDGWARAWEQTVGRACLSCHFAHSTLAGNPNVHPASRSARELWARPTARAALLHTWERRGFDAALRGTRVRVVHGWAEREADGADGFALVDVEATDFECERDDLREAVQFVSVDLAEVDADGVPALSRNRRLRHEDLRAPVAWDPLGLAMNDALSPAALLADARHAQQPGFFAVLSQHPRLTVEHVLARPDADWNWHTLSRAPNVTTPETLARHGALPFARSALVLNPAFDRATLVGLGLHGWMCAQHGYACGLLRPGVCGFDNEKLADVNWEIYLRLADDTERAVRRAHESGALDAPALCALIGNPSATLGQAAWAVARLAALGRLTPWALLTLAANELGAARAARAEAVERLRAERRAKAPAALQLLLRRGLPSALLPRLLAPPRWAPATVVGRGAGGVLVAFESAPPPLWLPTELARSLGLAE